MIAVSQTQDRSGFTDYLQSCLLPVNQADIRGIRSTGLTMALVEHAPCKGIEYDPVNELIISIVLRSSHESVVRDLGYGEHRFTDKPGQVLLTPPQQSSYWRFESSPLILHLGVPVQHLADMLDADTDFVESEISRAAHLIHDDPLISQIAARLWAIGCDSSNYSFKFSEKGLDTILMLLLGAKPPDGNPDAAALAPWRLRKVMDAIANQKSDISVAELARLVCLSPDHFSRAFKSTTGRSPHQVISEMRIERAKALLREADLSMTELALELGFSSSAHFSSRFRQLTGLTPTDWRTIFMPRD